MLYQALGLSQKLAQPLLLGGRESVHDRCGLTSECSERRNAGGEHVLRRSRESTGYTPYPHLETAGDASLLSRNKSQILPCGRDIDLFNLIRAPNPTKVKTESRPRAAHEVPLLNLTANRVVEMEDPAAATDSSGGHMAPDVPPPTDVPATSAPQAGQAEEVAATDPFAATESRKKSRDGADVNASPKVLRKDHADPRPTGSTHGGKSLPAIELGLASTRPVLMPENALAGVSDPDPLSFADPQSRHPADIAQ
nr:hypothetical protein [Tanacetum cinerariifolium]